MLKCLRIRIQNILKTIDFYFKVFNEVLILLFFVQTCYATHKQQMKWRSNHCSCDCDLSSRKVSPKNIFGASARFEPMASVLVLQCSTIWATKTHTLGAGQFIEFIVPVKEMKHMNIMWTADTRMKLRSDHRSCDCDLSNRTVSPKNVFGASTGSRWSPQNIFQGYFVIA